MHSSVAHDRPPTQQPGSVNKTMPADVGEDGTRQAAGATRGKPPPEVEGGWFRHILASAAASAANEGGRTGILPSSWGPSSTASTSTPTNRVSTTTTAAAAAASARRSYVYRRNRDETDEVVNDDEDDMKVREGYRRRLATYNPHNYFGKPPSISPVVCARFGWKVKDNDVLECEDCGATWTVEFPAGLVQGRAASRLTELYELEMSTRHRDEFHCQRYRTEARLYRDERIEACSATGRNAMAAWERRRLLPSAFVPIVSRATRMLWDDPVQCAEKFHRQYGAVLLVLKQSLPSDRHQWIWSVSDDVRAYRPECDNVLVGSSTAESACSTSWFLSSDPSRLLSRIIEAVDHRIRLVEAVETVNNSGSSPAAAAAAATTTTTTIGSVEELSAALVLFGWSESLLVQQQQQRSSVDRRSLPSSTEVGDGASETPTRQRNVWRLTCPFTLSVLTLVAQEKESSSQTVPGAAAPESFPLANHDVFKAHRYYSPYVCGFPITVDSSSHDGSKGAATALPIWKCLAARLLRIPEESHPTSSGTRSGVNSNDAVSESHSLKPYEAVEQALSVLRSTISPRLKRQRLES